MCIDCPTPRSRVRAVMREVVADVLLPVVLYTIPIALLVTAGHLRL
jgi:hypothetical protein